MRNAVQGGLAKRSFSIRGPRVRILLPPVKSPLRTCFLAGEGSLRQFSLVIAQPCFRVDEVEDGAQAVCSSDRVENSWAPWRTRSLRLTSVPPVSVWSLVFSSATRHARTFRTFTAALSEKTKKKGVLQRYGKGFN